MSGLVDAFLTIVWVNVAFFTVVASLALLLFVRTERRRRLITLTIVLLPVCGGLGLFASLNNNPLEFWLAMLFTFILYLVYARFIAPHFPQTDQPEIKVWGQDD